MDTSSLLLGVPGALVASLRIIAVMIETALLHYLLFGNLPSTNDDLHPPIRTSPLR